MAIDNFIFSIWHKEYYIYMLDARINFLTGEITHKKSILPAISTLYKAYNAIPNLKLKLRKPRFWHLRDRNKYRIKINDPKGGWWFNFYIFL